MIMGVIKMDFRKNAGIVLIILGMILTMDRTKDFHGIVSTILYKRLLAFDSLFYWNVHFKFAKEKEKMRPR